MLPFYEAIEIVDVISNEVGHTKPWVVRVKTQTGIENYVVKLYSREQVQSGCIITREVVSNLLADQFDLSSPKFAIIDLPEELIARQNSSLQIQYSQSDEHAKFATVVVDRAKTLTNGIEAKIFRGRVALDTLYAFDNLIRNSDRGHPKVNLLIETGTVYLIDHELAFQKSDISVKDIYTFPLDDRFTSNHFAFPYLKKWKGKKKQTIFDDFAMYLELMNIKLLNPYFKQLNDYGFPDYSLEIIEWLSYIKQNSTIFVERLKRTLHD